MVPDAPSARTLSAHLALPGPAPVMLTSTALVGTGLLLHRGAKVAIHVRAMRQRGREVPRLDLDLDLPGRRPLRRIAVLGDSSAAGHGLVDADQSVGRRVARSLAAQDGRATRLIGVAVDGADIRSVRRSQLEAARAAEVVLVGVGGNDAMRCHNPVGVARETAALLRELRDLAAPGAALLLVSAPDLSVAPGIPALLRTPLGLWCRSTAWAQDVAATESGVPVVSLPRDLLDVEVFGDDGLHPGPIGHARTADRILQVLAGR